MNDDQLEDRRRAFLTQRIAGGTFSAIAAKYNKAQVDAAIAAGRPADEAETVSATTVRKDVDIAKAMMLDEATRDALRGEHRAIILDIRRANYPAMVGGDIDAAKMIMSGLVREAEMLGLDDPKRTVVGVGTNVEFATDLVALIEGIGYQAPSDLVFAARGEITDRAEVSRDETIDAEVVESPFDLDAPEPSTRAAAVGATPGDAADDDDDADERRDAAAHGAASPEGDEPDAWSNL